MNTVDSTLEVLRQAYAWACRYGLPLILASTTGRTANWMIHVMNNRPIRWIVVTHNKRRVPAEMSFDVGIRQQVERSGGVVLMDKSPAIPTVTMARWFEKIFQISALRREERYWDRTFGTGGKVCFMMVERVLKAKMLCPGETVVAIGGKQTGADTALELKIDQAPPARISLSRVIVASSNTFQRCVFQTPVESLPIHPPSQGTPTMVGEECETDALRSLGEGGQIASADSAVRKGTAGMPAGLHEKS
ncbi:MAG: hypothetical protein NC930_05025 [Candidatus Omnitrophica bacterium]|nr:hypothetical protein [Candidatus Omnitrophota bacterium]